MLGRRRLLRDAAVMAGGAVVSLGARTKEALAAAMDFPDGITVSQGGSARWRFGLSPRTDSGLGFPVPTVRPVQPDSPVALDVMPSGHPQELPGEGVAWVDVCDRDVLDVSQAVVAAARVGIRRDRIEFGARFYNQASPRPVHVGSGTRGDHPNEPAIRLDPWGDDAGEVVLGADGSDVRLGSGAVLPGDATRGFPCIQAMDEGPTGAPQGHGITNPIVYNRAAKQLCVYDFDDGRWRTVDTF